MNAQRGSAHSYIAIALVLILLVVVSAVFINSLTKHTAKAELKTYTSISGSGLTFDYPSSWFFEAPTRQTVSRKDSKSTAMILYSQKPSLVNGRISIGVSNMCVTFNEMQGNWPFRSRPLGNSDKIADFSVGHSAVSLVENRRNLSASVYPAMQIVNRDTSSEHGGAYIALNNGYFLLATASKDCFISGNAKKKDVSAEIKQTQAILRSVRIKGQL